MKKVLHILTKENDDEAAEVISRQRVQPGCELVTVNLGVGQPDYAKLLEKIFAADSVAVW